MIIVDARKMLKYTTEELWENLTGEFICRFDDGDLHTNYKECIFSSYAWELHRLYPKTQLLKRHHLKTVIGDNRVSSSTHLKLIGNCLWSVYDAYQFDNIDRVKLLDTLAEIAYIITNRIYNELTYRLEEYVTSIDILDFIEVTNHPKLLKAMSDLKPTQDSISNVYSEIKEIINDRENFKDNPLAKAVRSSIVDINQVMQCIGPRGFLTDIDSHQFKKPVMRGYVQGIRSLHDSMVESRSAAKSLAYSNDTLQKSEYFSRRQQLICQNVQNLHMVDCGSTQYLMWRVRDAKYEGNVKIRDNDLKTICGKYYFDDDSNSLKIIKITDDHLIGKTIKIRSVVAGCMHPDPYGVCEVCFGETSLSIPAKTNLGHAACVSMTEKISQIVLSTKHLDGSATIEGISLKPFEKKYLNAPVNGNLYYLNPDLKNKQLSIIIEPSCAPGLTDINLVSDVKKLNISRVSEFSTIVLVISDSKGTDIVPINVSVNKRFSNMSHSFLKHIKTYGWTVNKDNKYSIDMLNWDYSLPLLSLPMRHFSMGDHQSEIAVMLEATVKDLTYRDSVISPTAMLIEFHDLVNRKLSINLAILDIVVYSSMVVSANDGDYSLPKPWTSSGIGVMRLLLNNRSIAPAMAFERHKDSISAPSNYINTNRPAHIFDSLILPNEVLNEIY